MSTSAIPSVLAYLADTFAAAPQLAMTKPPVTTYYCGPLTTDWPEKTLWIGCDDPDSSPYVTGASSRQEWVGPGNRKRNENLSIPCVAQYFSGDEDARAVVDGAFEIVSIVEDMTRDDASLGGNILFTDPGVTNIDFRYGQYKNGPMVRVLFTIDGFARIGN